MVKSQLKWFVIIFCILGFVANDVYRHDKNTTAEKTLMRNDSEGYYQYLPHFFIKDWNEMDKMHWAKRYDDGKTLNVYTCGVAIMQTPFFLAAHAFSYFFGLEMTGYTPIYFTFVFFASLFYSLLGLLFIYKCLRNLVSHKAALWTIILTYFATNLLYYTAIIPGFSHAYSFSAIAVFIYFVPEFYKKPGVKYLLLLALPLALATLIRPTNIFIAFYLFLYDVYSFKDLKYRINYWLKSWYYLLVLLIIGFIMYVPQMLYWHTVTGDWIVYSYMDERFTNFLSPKIFTVLFGPRNGWFIYTPLMIFSALSLIYLAYKRQLSSWAIIFVLILIIYMNGSWWRPTFSSAAGYRALIEYLPFMAIPFAWFFENIYLKKNTIIKYALSFTFGFFVVFNILFMYKYNAHIWWNEPWEWSNFLMLVRF